MRFALAGFAKPPATRDIISGGGMLPDEVTPVLAGLFFDVLFLWDWIQLSFPLRANSGDQPQAHSDRRVSSDSHQRLAARRARHHPRPLASRTAAALCFRL